MIVIVIGGWIPTRAMAGTAGAMSNASGGVSSDGIASAEGASGEEPSGRGTSVPASSGVADKADARASRRAAPPPPLGIRYAEPLEDGGERFRVGYDYLRVQRQGLLVADRDISPGQVRNNSFLPYTRTPRSLEIELHVLRLAWAPHPRVTLAVEIPVVRKTLETLDSSGLRSEVETRGIGDVAFAVVVPFIKKGRERSHVHVGFDVPTGSFRRGGDVRRLPYDSQIGNGTVDLEWGWTYQGEIDGFSWGGQALGRHPVGRNGLHYREGSRFDVTAWAAVELLPGWSASARLAWQKQNNIRGRDRSFDPVVDPAENAKARGGTRLTISPGMAFSPSCWPNQRVSVEVGVPIHQDLDGPQLEEDWSVKAGWQWAF